MMHSIYLGNWKLELDIVAYLIWLSATKKSQKMVVARFAFVNQRDLDRMHH